MNLWLITSSFPFGNGEQFLENELPYLSATFNEITIIPYNVDKGNVREVPKNVAINTELASYRERKMLKPVGWFLLFLISGWWLRRVFWSDFRMRSMGLRELSKLCWATFNYYSDLEWLRGIKVKPPVLIYNYWMTTFALTTTNFFRQYGTKVITRAHGFDLYPKQTGLKYLPIQKNVISAVDRVYPVSVDGKELLSRTYPEYSKKILTRHLGTPYPIENPQHQKSKGAHFRVVSCSMLIKLKRVHVIHTYLKRYADNREIKIEWTHIGEGDLFNSLKEKVRTSNSEFMKVNLLGHVPNKEVHKILSNGNFDLFINLSTSEGLPVSMMEAQSYGVPVLATDVGGVDEIITTTTGKLISGNLTYEKFENALSELLKDLSTFKSASIDNWTRKFNAKTNYKMFAEELLELAVMGDSEQTNLN